MKSKKACTTVLVALALGLCSLQPRTVEAKPVIHAKALIEDRRLFDWSTVVVELGTFGISGALVRFNAEKQDDDVGNGIAIEPAAHGAVLSYHATF